MIAHTYLATAGLAIRNGHTQNQFAADTCETERATADLNTRMKSFRRGALIGAVTQAYFFIFWQGFFEKDKK